MIKISIIVTVFNVEQYLEKCLDSLVKQTLNDIEIIIVNDGSTDNSQKIIDKYTKKYKNIKSYIKSNGGVSSARNYGLKYAKGKYITFVDSDDYVEYDMYEKMYNKAISGDFDIVACNINYVDSDNNFLFKVSSHFSEDMIERNKIKKSMTYFYPSLCNTLYKRFLFFSDKISFKENVWFEDVELLYKIYPRINSIGVVNDYLYNYVQHDGSITNTFDKRLYNYIDNWNGIIEYYKQKDLYNEYKLELEYCYVRYLYATFIKRASKYKNKKEFNTAVNTAIKNVKNNFPKYRKNKYFYTSLKGIYLVTFNKFYAYILFKKGRKL